MLQENPPITMQVPRHWNRAARSQRVFRRRGAALVEFAVCLPMLMLLILGSIEATSAIFLRQALVTSAYEGIREATRTDGTAVSALDKAQSVLNARRVRDSTVEFVPSDTEKAARGTLIEVHVRAPYQSNSPFIGNVIPNQTIEVRSVMVRE